MNSYKDFQKYMHGVQESTDVHPNLGSFVVFTSSPHF